MKTYIYKLSTLALLALTTACQTDELEQSAALRNGEVQLGATIQDATIQTRAFGDEKGDEVALPYIYEINVRMDGETADKIYHVKSANKGTLEQGTGTNDGKAPFIWNNKANDINFFAWTTPQGVTIDNSNSQVTEGVVNFTNEATVGGNYFDRTTGDATNVTSKNSINNKNVTPLEVLISAYAKGNYTLSPSVSLPFKHLVSKLSICVRDDEYNDITTGDVSIEFLSIPNQWKIKQETTSPFRITEASNADALSLTFKNLQMKKFSEYDYVVCYLPPLDESTTSSCNLDNCGDFCITYDNNDYYGTLKDCLSDNKLAAGEHMRIIFDLTKNYGVGVGAWIDEWDYAKPQTVYTNPRRGIYTLEGWKLFRDHLKNSSALPDSLYTESPGDSHKTIRLYNNLDLSKESAENLALDFAGFTFDGQGYTITLPTTGSKSLFGTVGANGKTTTIQNLYIKGGTITNASPGTTQGILASILTGGGTGNTTTISNCHILEGSITNEDPGSNTGAIAGQISGSNVTIQYCSSIANVTGKTNVGGLIGEVTNGISDITITGCYANCNVTTSGGNAGGLVGNLAAGTMKSCFFYSGTVSGVTYNGALVGSYSSSTITDCYWGITSTSTLGAAGSGTEIATGSFLTESHTQTETEGDVTYKAGTFGSFPGGTFTATEYSSSSSTKYSTLLEALIAGTTGVTINDKSLDWVYVYSKDYPVIKIE